VVLDGKLSYRRKNHGPAGRRATNQVCRQVAVASGKLVLKGLSLQVMMLQVSRPALPANFQAVVTADCAIN